MKNRGFTLLELLGVIVVLALLTTLVFPSVLNAIKNSSNQTDKLSMDLISNAVDLYIETYANDFKKRNGSKFIIDMDELIESGNLPSNIKISDIDNIEEKCVQVTYNDDFDYELKDKGTCEYFIALPEEYQQVEYIESTGTQYIFTEIQPKFDWSFELKFSNFVLGTKEQPPTFFSTAADESGYYYELNQNTFNYIDVTDSFEFELKNSSNVDIISFDGTTIAYNNIVMKSFTPNTHESIYKLVLFRNRLDATESFQRYASLKLYSLKFFDGTDTLHDLIPCYRKVDNVIGVYDLIEDKFYINSGTGTLVKGKDI